MNISLASIDPLMAIIFGVLVFAFPKMLNYLIAIYLIISGLLGLGIISF